MRDPNFGGQAGPGSGVLTEPLEVFRSDANARRGLVSDLREIGSDLWRSRDLLYQMTLRNIRIRYKQAVMGFGWAVLMPILIVLSGCLVRVAMAELSGTAFQRVNIAGLAVKSLPWAFFVGSMGFAVQSLTGNLNLVSKIYFPREVLPLSATLAQLFDTGMSAVFLALVLPFLSVPLSTGLLWLPLLVALIVVLTTAACLVVSCANLFFRDVKYIVQVLLTFGIFFTPVLFEPAMLGPTGAQLVMLNPLAPLLEGVRLSVVGGHNLLEPLTSLNRHGVEVLVWQPWYLGYSAVWGIGGLLGSALLFHRLEFVFAEYI